jgi:hypothetical protein
MAFTQDDLTALDSAIARGVKRVQYGTRTVDYQTTDEMLRLRSVMQAEIAGTTSPWGTRRVYPEYGKGA